MLPGGNLWQEFCVFLNPAKHLEFLIMRFIGPLAAWSPFFTWLAASYTVYLARNATAVVYPKRRLTLQYPKHCRFSHTGVKSSHSCVVSLALMWDFEPRWTYYIIYSKNQGWSSPVLTAHPALGPTDSKRPKDFSQAAERSLKGLITSRPEAMDI